MAPPVACQPAMHQFKNHVLKWRSPGRFSRQLELWVQVDAHEARHNLRPFIVTRRAASVTRTWVAGTRLFAPASARPFGSLLPLRGIACRLTACPGWGAGCFMTAPFS